MGFNDTSTLKGHIRVSTNGYVVKLKTYIEKTEVTQKHKRYTQVSVREIKNCCTIISQEPQRPGCNTLILHRKGMRGL